MTDDHKLEIPSISFAASVSDEVQNIDKCISVYQSQLEQGDIQRAYHYLLRYVMYLKTQFSDSLSGRFSFGNVSPGYMDFTYFPFFDDYLRERKLRFGIVLNHRALRFELWLMGQNTTVQKAYWNELKNSAWNAGRTEMPRYSILEAVLLEASNFRQADLLATQVKEEALRVSEAITDAIRAVEGHGKPC